MTTYLNGWREPVPGPRIERLRAELRTAPDTAALVEEFWHEVEASGAPLVAPAPGDDEGVAVTFLWRDADPAVEHVALAGPLVIWDRDRNLLRRIEGTDVFHLTLRLPRDSRMTYAFGPNDNLDGFSPVAFLSGEEAKAWAESPRGRRDWRADPLNPAFWPPEGSWVATRNPGTRMSLLDLAPDADAEILSWVTAAPEREVIRHRMTSALLGMEREYGSYLPGVPVENVIWSFEWGGASTWAPLQPVVDGLVRTGRLGPTAILFIGIAEWMASKELFLDLPFADFVRDELVPEVRRHHDLPGDPARNVITGFSAGGTAAAFLALRAPSIFGRALLESPGVGLSPRGHEPRELYDWYRHRLPAPTGTRFVLTAGAAEVDRLTDAPSVWDGVVEFEAVLRELGCDVSVRTGPYTHDALGWRIQTARALPDLIGRRSETNRTEGAAAS